MMRTLSQNDPLLTVPQVADRAGLPLSRVRYYERAGLLPRPEGAGRQRRYRASVVDRIHVITEAQEAGLSLAEIRELVELSGLALEGPVSRPGSAAA